MNKQRKIFLGLAVGGAIVYAIYRKFGTSVVAATATPVNTTNFTGRSYYSATGGDCGCSDCHKLSEELALVRHYMSQSHLLTPDQIGKLHSREAAIVAMQGAAPCADH